MKPRYGVILALAAGAANAESWECTERFGADSAVLVKAITATPEAPSTGTISVAGTEFRTYYYVDGFDRRWDFGDAKDGAFPFSFVIRPNGDGNYFDFRGAVDGRAAPSQFFSCKVAKK